MKIIITRSGKNIGVVDINEISNASANDTSIVFTFNNDIHNSRGRLEFSNLKEQDIKNIFSQIKKFNEKI